MREKKGGRVGTHIKKLESADIYLVEKKLTSLLCEFPQSVYVKGNQAGDTYYSSQE